LATARSLKKIVIDCALYFKQLLNNISTVVQRLLFNRKKLFKKSNERKFTKVGWGLELKIKEISLLPKKNLP
jgi:hypothetical protein